MVSPVWFLVVPTLAPRNGLCVLTAAVAGSNRETNSSFEAHSGQTAHTTTGLAVWRPKTGWLLPMIGKARPFEVIVRG